MKLGYTIIYVADVQATLRFYNTAFGLETQFIHESGDYGELATGETVLAFASHDLGAANVPQGLRSLSEMDKPAGIEIALVTDDVGSAVRSALQAGASLITDPVVKPWGQTVGYVRAPDGMLIELCTPVAGE